MYEYYRVRMVVSIDKCLTTQLGYPPDPGDEFETIKEVERHGMALNEFEAEESLAQFMAQSAVETLMEVCGHSDCEAGAQIAKHANDTIPEGC